MTGEDRVRFLNGQVTNDVKSLAPWTGCYSAMVNAKGRMRGDAVILHVGDAFLLDLEADCVKRIAGDFEKFIVADDVTVGDVSAAWRTLTVGGEKAAEVLQSTGLCGAPPEKLFQAVSLPKNLGAGLVYRSRRAVCGTFDVWIETARGDDVFLRLREAVERSVGVVLDEAALDILRVEAGIPRFGSDMDEGTLPPEAGLEAVAISYTKGCYVGQEVISRLKSVGHANRQLVRLRLPEAAQRNDPLTRDGKEVGRLASVVTSPRCGRIGLALIRREAATEGTELALPHGTARVVAGFFEG